MHTIKFSDGIVSSNPANASTAVTPLLVSKTPAPATAYGDKRITVIVLRIILSIEQKISAAVSAFVQSSFVQKVSSSVWNKNWSPLTKLCIGIFYAVLAVGTVLMIKYVAAAAIAATLFAVFLYACIYACIVGFACFQALLAKRMADDM